MGCFDTVHFSCPNCTVNVEAQSKSGDCLLDDYPQGAVPLDVAGGLIGAEVECDSCQETFTIIPRDGRTVPLRLSQGASF